MPLGISKSLQQVFEILSDRDISKGHERARGHCSMQEALAHFPIDYDCRISECLGYGMVDNLRMRSAKDICNNQSRIIGRFHAMKCGSTVN